MWEQAMMQSCLVLHIASFLVKMGRLDNEFQWNIGEYKIMWKTHASNIPIDQCIMLNFICKTIQDLVNYGGYTRQIYPNRSVCW